MKNARPVLWGIIIVLAVIIFILGAVLLSVVEARINNKTAPQPATSTSTTTLTATAIATLPPVSPTPSLPSSTPLSPTATFPATSSESVTPPASATSPSLPSPTTAYQSPATPVPCSAPAGWVTYIVQPGDTLYHLSLAYGVTVGQLQQANCMGPSTLLRTGQILFVPPVAAQPTVYYPPTLVPTSTLPPLPTSLP